MPTNPNPSPDVESFFKSLPAFSKPICEKLRKIVLSTLPQARESLKWGNPAYQLTGLVCVIAAMKAHVNLTFFRGAEINDRTKAFREGEGKKLRSIKFESVDQINEKVIRDLLKQAGEVDKLPSKRASQPKKPVVAPEIPSDLKTNLAKVPKARANFEALSPSCKKEYITWIGEAKREATRAARIEQTISMLQRNLKLRDKWACVG